MPHPTFRRVVGPDPNNGIKGDLVRPSLFNDIYEALENTPTEDDVSGVIGVTAGDYRTAISWDENGNAGKAGIPVSPLLFGAVGDGVTDDSAALASMFTALGLSTPGDVTHGTGIIIDGHNRSYVITEPLTIDDTWFLTMRNFRFVVSGTIDTALLLRGVSFSFFDNIHIKGVAAWSSSHTADYGIRLESNQTADPVGSVSTQNSFTHCTVIDLKTKYGIAIGPTSANLQVSETRLIDCQATGQYTPDVGDATWYQKGIIFGSGTSGNILNNWAYGCQSVGYKYSVEVSSTDLTWMGGIVQTADANFRQGGEHPLYAVGFRSEGSRRLFAHISAAGTAAAITFESFVFDCDELDADTYWIKHETMGSLVLRGVRLSAIGSGISPKIRMAHGTANSLYICGMQAAVAMGSAYSLNGSTYSGIIIGYTQLSQVDGSVVASYPGMTLIGESPISAVVGGTPFTIMNQKNAYGGPFFPTRTFTQKAFEVWSDGTTSIHYRTRAAAGANDKWSLSDSGLQSWGDGTAAVDTTLGRSAADTLALGANDSLNLPGGHIQFTEISDPAAGAANTGRLYVKDNGSGKSQLVVRFPSGAVQVIATEP